mmetsp:Transcript_32573/g.49149  ORF Transcript_32573/g.49149 Transcript_32573/m.49149 type:complete len:86 (-) Transcript_32573:3399-3656(-)
MVLSMNRDNGEGGEFFWMVQFRGHFETMSHHSPLYCGGGELDWFATQSALLYHRRYHQQQFQTNAVTLPEIDQSENSVCGLSLAP